MHALGIRHQDVKPDNIFLARIPGFRSDDEEEEILPVLIDLGVAAKEAEMVVAGTPNYFAPEVAAQFAQAGEAKPITPAADIFSLALSLRNALEPETQEDVAPDQVEPFIERRARERPPPCQRRELAFLAPHFERWMSSNPSERPTADELATELEVLTRPEERRERIVGIARWLLPAVITVAAVFASVVYVLNARAERERETASLLREDLAMTREQRERLSDDVKGIRERYEESQLTRNELTEELAQKEGQLGLARRRVRALQSERRRLGEALREREGELETARQSLAKLEGELTSVRRELEDTQRRARELSEARDQLMATQTKLEAGLEASEARGNEARAKLRSVQERLAEVERKLAEATSKREQAERRAEARATELAAAKKKIRALERKVATLERRADDGPAGGRSGPAVPDPEPPIPRRPGVRIDGTGGQE
jgi:predicted nuclease with TOPRIM domain